MAITDLTGCVWVANNNITASNSYTTYNINFSNNNISGSNVKIPLANYNYGKVFSSGVNDNTFNDLCLNSSNQWIIYNNDDEYVVETIGTLEITITGGSDATNTTLIAWLEANGTLTAPQSTLTPPSIGNKDIVGVFVGNKQVKSMWLGSVKIYEGGAIEYTQNGDILTITNAPYTLNGDILTIGE